MAREKFQDISFNSDIQNIIDQVNEVIEEYAADGYDLTLRQIYYQFIARDLFPQSWVDDEYNTKNHLPEGTKNTDKNYKRLGVYVGDARLAGLVDWDAIKDRGREAQTNSHWEGPADIVEACSKQFRIDCWEDQDTHVEVMVEKQALEGVLLPVCQALDITFSANKGYSSLSAMYEAGKRLAAYADEGKELVVIYLGDHDPSGIDMSRDVGDRLRMFSCCDVTIERVALNMAQINVLHPPENPTKLNDPRAGVRKDGSITPDSYVDRFGFSSWELDAIEPRRLVELVTNAVKGHRDEKKWKAKQRVQNGMRARLVDAAARLEAED
jgi:hypothetical protein